MFIFSHKPFNRDPATDLLYRSLAALSDIIFREGKGKINTLEELISAQQKIDAIQKLTKEFDILTDIYMEKDKNSGSVNLILNNYEYLIIGIQTSPEPLIEILKKYQPSPLKDDKLFQELLETTLDPKKVIEKHMSDVMQKKPGLFNQ